MLGLHLLAARVTPALRDPLPHTAWITRSAQHTQPTQGEETARQDEGPTNHPGKLRAPATGQGQGRSEPVERKGTSGSRQLHILQAT